MSHPLPLSALSWLGGRSISTPQVSPDRAWVAFLTKGSERRELALLPSGGGAERWLGLDPSASSCFAWCPDSAGIIYWGQDLRLHRYELINHSTTTLSDPIAELSGLTVAAMPGGGARIVYVTDLALLWQQDSDGPAKPIPHDADFVIDPVLSPCGRWLAWTQWLVPNMAWDNSQVILSDLAAARSRVVAGGNNSSAQQPRFSPSGQQLAYLCDAGGWLNVYWEDLKTGEVKSIDAPNREHGGPIWGPGNSSLAWLDENRLVSDVNEGGFHRSQLIDVNDRRALQVAAGGWSSISASGGTAAALESGPDRPNALVAYNGKSTATLAISSPAGLVDRAVVPELVSWRSDDGLLVHGRLYRSGTGPSPMLLWVHGGPTDQSPATLYHRFGYFVERGWSVLAVDYRGSTGWGRDYTQALRGRWGVDDVLDCAGGVKAAIENGWALSGKVVAYGGSAGGFTVLNLANDFPELFAGVIAMYPVCDLVDLAANTHRFESHYLLSMIGDPQLQADAYKRRSPINRLDGVAGPVLLLHGDRDVVVPLEQTQAYYRTLNERGIPVQLQVYEGEGHGWRQLKTRQDELERVEKFLEQLGQYEQVDQRKGEAQ